MILAFLSGVVATTEVLEVTSGAYEQFIQVLEAIDPDIIGGYVERFVNVSLGILTAFGGIFGYAVLKYNKMKLLLTKEAVTADAKVEKVEAVFAEVLTVVTDTRKAFEATMLHQSETIENLKKDNLLAAEMLQLIIKNGTLNPELLVEFGMILERVGDKSLILTKEFEQALLFAKERSTDTTSILDKAK
jgi:hypothetical protein